MVTFIFIFYLLYKKNYYSTMPICRRTYWRAVIGVQYKQYY